MVSALTVRVTVRWWLKASLAGGLIPARLTRCEPDWIRVRYWVGRGVKTRVR